MKTGKEKEKEWGMRKTSQTPGQQKIISECLGGIIGEENEPFVTFCYYFWEDSRNHLVMDAIIQILLPVSSWREIGTTCFSTDICFTGQCTFTESCR